MTTIRAIRTPENDDMLQIQRGIEEFAQAFRAKDLKRVIAGYAPEIVAFNMMPPLKYVGLQAWEKLWETSLSQMDGEISLEMKNLNIEVSGKLAVAHGLSHFTMHGSNEADIWMRWTGVFHKINNKWLVVHEHTSVPTDMESGKALPDLKP